MSEVIQEYMSLPTILKIDFWVELSNLFLLMFDMAGIFDLFLSKKIIIVIRCIYGNLLFVLPIVAFFVYVSLFLFPSVALKVLFSIFLLPLAIYALLEPNIRFFKAMKNERGKNE